MHELGKMDAGRIHRVFRTGDEYQPLAAEGVAGGNRFRVRVDRAGLAGSRWLASAVVSFALPIAVPPPRQGRPAPLLFGMPFDASWGHPGRTGGHGELRRHERTAFEAGPDAESAEVQAFLVALDALDALAAGLGEPGVACLSPQMREEPPPPPPLSFLEAGAGGNRFLLRGRIISPVPGGMHAATCLVHAFPPFEHEGCNLLGMPFGPAWGEPGEVDGKPCRMADGPVVVVAGPEEAAMQKALVAASDVLAEWSRRASTWSPEQKAEAKDADDARALVEIRELAARVRRDGQGRHGHAPARTMFTKRLLPLSDETGAWPSPQLPAPVPCQEGDSPLERLAAHLGLVFPGMPDMDVLAAPALARIIRLEELLSCQRVFCDSAAQEKDGATFRAMQLGDACGALQARAEKAEAERDAAHARLYVLEKEDADEHG